MCRAIQIGLLPVTVHSLVAISCLFKVKKGLATTD